MGSERVLAVRGSRCGSFKCDSSGNKRTGAFCIPRLWTLAVSLYSILRPVLRFVFLLY